METYNLGKISNQWRLLAPLLSVPRTKAEYDNLVNLLDHLIDAVGNNERHPLASLMDTIGTLIESYENEHYPFSQGNPLGALKYLMKVNGLTQSDLPEVGSQGVVSEIISGKRSLNTRQIRALSKQFHVSPSTFF